MSVDDSLIGMALILYGTGERASGNNSHGRDWFFSAVLSVQVQYGTILDRANLAITVNSEAYPEAFVD